MADEKTKLLLLARADFDAAQADLADMAERAARLTALLGPAYGPAWQEKARRVEHGIKALKGQLEGRFYAQTPAATAAAQTVAARELAKPPEPAQPT